MNVPQTDLLERLAKVRLLALDVDGVLTDGGLYYTNEGVEMKKFNVKDGQGLQLLRQAGIEVALISASASTATLHRAETLGIQYAYVGKTDKLPILKDICQQLQIDLSQVAYAGDDLKDLPILQAVGCPLTVADAMPANRSIAIYVTERNGGQAAVREICELIITSLDKQADCVPDNLPSKVRNNFGNSMGGF